MRELYRAVDLHSNNGCYGIVEKSGKRVFGKRLPNKIDVVVDVLSHFKEEIKTIAVESTYNWYWLVDGLVMDGYDVKLANPAAMDQYSGLKSTDDKSDAFFIAEMPRPGVLPEGHIHPKDERHRRIRKGRQLHVIRATR